MLKYKRIKLFILALLLCFSCLSFIRISAQDEVRDNKQAFAKERDKTEILIKYKNKTNNEALGIGVKNKLRLQQFSIKQVFDNNKINIIEINQNDDINKVIQELKKNPDVEYVQPNYKLEVQSITQDPEFGEQWALQNKGQEIGKQCGRVEVDINIQNAWKVTKGAPSTVVGVLDTGIDIAHEDLSDNIFHNTREIPANGIDDDDNGYIDDVNGWDFANNDNTLYDEERSDRHGTKVAGIIAAKANNKGIVGVAPGVKVLPLKFIHNGIGYTSDLINAINYAEKMGVKIINCSFGSTIDNPALKEIMQSSKILFVCAAGNRGEDTAQHPVYPAAFDLPNILSVGAIDANGVLARFSSYGSDVDIVAPGVNILTTSPYNDYTYLSGTSAAAPHVTGSAALLISKIPTITTSVIVDRIKRNVVECNTLQEKVSTRGRLDANAVLVDKLPHNDTYNGPGLDSSTIFPGKQGTGEDSWYALNETAEIKEKMHYGENGVNPLSGNYSITSKDITVKTPGFELVLGRTYNSQGPSYWNSSFEGGFFADERSGKASVSLPNGRIEFFDDYIQLANGRIYTSIYTRDTLNVYYVSGGTSHGVLNTKDGYTYRFEDGWNLSSMSDKYGNSIQIVRNEDNFQIDYIVDSVGRVYDIQYYPNTDLMSAIVDPIGRRVSYYYTKSSKNQWDLLSRVVDVNGNSTYYSYFEDDFGQCSLNKIMDNNKNVLLSLTYGFIVEKAADMYGNIYNYSDDSVYSGQKITTVTDSNQNTWIYRDYDTEYDILDNMGSVEVKIQPNGTKTLTDTNHYYFDEISLYVNDKGNITKYIRDDRGNVIKTINPDLSFREYSYDDKNNLISEKDEDYKAIYYIYNEGWYKDISNHTCLLKKVQPLDGHSIYDPSLTNFDASKFAITEYEYYSANEAQTFFGCSVKGLLKSIKDPEGNTITYTYDKYGYIKTVSDPETNKVTTYGYNNNAAINIGWKTTEITPGGYRTDYQYNLNGQLEKIIQNNGETTRIVYDALGDKVQEVSPELYNPLLESLTNKTYTGNHGFRHEYYSHGKLRKTVDPENNITEYTYDIYGNKQTEKKANGAIYRYVYDTSNRLIKEYYRDSATASEVLLKEYTYKVLYGTAYARMFEKEPDVDTPDSRFMKTELCYLNNTEKATTVYIYDYNDRLLEQQNPDGTVIKIKYNSNGSIQTRIEANGRKTINIYDGLNRLRNQWIANENANGTIRYKYVEYGYDKAGNKILETTGLETVLYPYASSNSITKSYTYYKNNKLKTVTIDGKLRNEYHYDNDGNLDWEKAYTSATGYILTEYTNNHLGKPDVRKIHVRKGDIAGNIDTDTTNLVLETAYTYDKNGNLQTEKTPNNVTTTYTYDNMNRLTGTSQPGINENGTVVNITTGTTYNWEGKPLTKTDPNSNITTYYYTARGFLDKVVDAKGGITKYYYDLGGRKVAEVSPKYYDSAKTLEQMNRKAYEYDLMDRVITEKDIYFGPVVKISWYMVGTRFVESTYIEDDWTTINTKSYKYDANGNVIKELDALGYKTSMGKTTQEKIDMGYGTEYTYNLANKPVTVLDPVSKERGLSYTVKNEYDTLGRKTTETNAKGTITKYEYDSNGNILSIRVKKNSAATEKTVKSATYDLAGRKLTETDGNGNTTTYEYNTFGKERKVIQPGDATIPVNTIKCQYDVMGNPAKMTDSVGAVDTYTYDNQGRLLSHTRTFPGDSKTLTVSVKYDKNGNKRYEWDGNNTRKEYTYTTLNQLESERITANGKLKTTSYIYDKNGNQEAMTDWRGNVYTNVYDPLNRLIEKRDPYTTVQKLEYYDNHTQWKSYDALNSMTEYKYDKNSRLLETIDPELHKNSQTYDNVGNIETKKDGKNNTTTFGYDEYNRLITVTNAKNEITSYAYDGNGNMLTQTDAKGNMTTCEYNAANKLVRRIDHGGRTGTSGSYQYDSKKGESYTYYADRQMKTKTDRNGKTATYTYGVQGKVNTIQAGVTNISYIYDGNGNVLSMTDCTGTTTRRYDEENRVKSSTVPYFGTTVYTYDQEELGGMYSETITDPKGYVTKKVYDKVGRIKQVIGDNKVTSYEYYNNGNCKSVTYPNGTIEEYTYYKDNLNKTLVNKSAAGAIIESFSYTYDSAHNQLIKTDKKGVTSYTYDSLNRLKTITEPGGRITNYTFDKAGNRETEEVTVAGNKVITTYEYNEQNRLMAVNTLENGIKRITRYCYDNNGNMFSQKNVEIKPAYENTEESFIVGVTEGIGSEMVSLFSYDELNRLTKISNANNVTRFRYNGDGLRIEKDTNGTIIRYLYEADKVTLETDGSGNEFARNMQGINTISRKIGGQTVYYLYNGHADVTALIGTDGTIVAQYYYDAFGNIVEETGNVNNSITFAGYEYDRETGMYYLNARFYDPKIARFITEDTYRGDPNDPLSLNIYTYCHNEPIMYKDPSGHKEYTGDEDEELKKQIDELNKLVDEFEKAETYGDRVDVLEKVSVTLGFSDREDRIAIARQKVNNIIDYRKKSNEVNNKNGEPETEDPINKSLVNSKITGEKPGTNGSDDYYTIGSKAGDALIGWILSVNDSVVMDIPVALANFTNQMQGKDSFSKEEWLKNPDVKAMYTAGNITNALYGVKQVAGGFKLLAKNGGEILVSNSGEIIQVTTNAASGALKTADGARIVLSSTNNNQSSINTTAEGSGEAGGTTKNTKTLWDIKTNASGKIDYKFNGSNVTAYQDPNTGLWWAKDTTGHANSAYKVFKKQGKELNWVADADEYGNYIVNKHKSDTGMKIKLP